MGKGKDGCLASCAKAYHYYNQITVVVVAGLAIAQIVMGAMHLHDCSIEHFIPIWLIVSGAGFLSLSGYGLDKKDPKVSFVLVISLLFNIAWLICGSVWVYPNYTKVTADNFYPCTASVITNFTTDVTTNATTTIASTTTTSCTQGDCDKSLITFAFAVMIVNWIFIGHFLVLSGYAMGRFCERQDA